MKNVKKVLRNVSEADFERYFSSPEIRRCSGGNAPPEAIFARF